EGNTASARGAPWGGWGQPFRIDGHIVTLGGSLGVVAPPRRGTGITADALVHQADSAMYSGKRQGKGIAVHYRPEVTPDMRPGRDRAGEQWLPGTTRVVPNVDEVAEVVPDIPRDPAPGRLGQDPHPLSILAIGR